MPEYTPTTREVRHAYDVYWAGFGVTEPRDSGDLRAEFDRWYAEEIRKAKEEAWNEGCAHAGRYGHEDCWDFEPGMWPFDDNPYRIPGVDPGDHYTETEVTDHD